MKKIFLVIILLLVSLGLFAEWQIGDFIDDFGDITGEHFLYCMAEGTFSNSATSNSPCIVRVVANLNNVYLVPYVSKFEFEIHEYNNDNPVQEFYEDSKSIIRIKDDLGKQLHTLKAIQSIVTTGMYYITMIWNHFINNLFQTI